MTRDEYIKTKSRLAAIDDALHDGHFTPEETSELEALSVALSQRLVAPWIPADWARRSLMLSLSAAGVYGLVTGLEVLLWCWPFVLAFSPRITGENFHAVGRREHG